MKHFILLFAFVALSYSQVPSTEGPSQIIGIPGPRWQGPLANHILGQPVGDTSEVAAAKAAHYLAHARILEILPELPPQERYQTSNVVQPQVYIPQQPPQQVTFVPQQSYVVQPPAIQTTTFPPPVQNVQQFTQSAEDIPRSELGEVPEVAAARRAHLAAYEEIKKLLPKLEESIPGVQQPQVPQVVTQQPQSVYQEPQVVAQIPQVVYQQPQVVGQVKSQQELSNLEASQLYNQQLQRNLEWFYNPKQFYTFVPQDTPEVAAAKIEHLKLLQALS